MEALSETGEFVQAAYHRMLIAAHQTGKISQTWYENLSARSGNDLDEIEKNCNDFRYALEHAEYYALLERIEKGEEMLAAETDPKKKTQYSKLLKSLVEQMERVRPE